MTLLSGSGNGAMAWAPGYRRTHRCDPEGFLRAFAVATAVPRADPRVPVHLTLQEFPVADLHSAVSRCVRRPGIHRFGHAVARRRCRSAKPGLVPAVLADVGKAFQGSHAALVTAPVAAGPPAPHTLAWRGAHHRESVKADGFSPGEAPPPTSRSAA